MIRFFKWSECVYTYEIYWRILALRYKRRGLLCNKILLLYVNLRPHSAAAAPAAVVRLRLKCDGTRKETTFRLSAKRTSPFKSAGASIQSTTGSRGVRISGSNAGYTKFRGSVKSTGCPLHSPVSPSLPIPCVTVCHHFSTGLYRNTNLWHTPIVTCWDH